MLIEHLTFLQQLKDRRTLSTGTEDEFSSITFLQLGYENAQLYMKALLGYVSTRRIL